MRSAPQCAAAITAPALRPTADNASAPLGTAVLSARSKAAARLRSVEELVTPGAIKDAALATASARVMVVVCVRVIWATALMVALMTLSLTQIACSTSCV